MALTHRSYESKKGKTKREIDKIDTNIDEIDDQNHKSTILRVNVEKTSKDLEMQLFWSMSKC